MNKIISTLLFLTCSWFVQALALDVNIISQCNGKGLEGDKLVLEAALEALDCNVHFVDTHHPEDASKADINIFCQFAMPRLFSYAALNWYIPNPEWCYTPVDVLREFDLILCRTREVERIFKKLGLPTYYIGFTSTDCHIKGVEKDFSSLVHIAGGSAQKGTSAIGATWMRNRNFPHITVIRHVESVFADTANFQWISERLPLEELRLKQNSSGIHLCLSETEGYGHYLMEAMSCGAVVLTTNAPPMNEFISDPRCLVAYRYTSRQQYATNYYVAAEGLDFAMRRLLSLPREELKAIGKINRKRYLMLRKQFYTRLNQLIESVQIDKR